MASQEKPLDAGREKSVSSPSTVMSILLRPFGGARPASGRSLALVVALLGVVALFVLAPPLSFEAKVKSVAYGICHQIPARSFFLAGHQLPLCARNTGIFLGALLTLGLLFLTGRGRCADLPSARLLLALGLFTAAMGIDGLNSYLTFFPDLPRLYEPSNFLRLATGAFHGLAMALVTFPLFNSVLWRDARPRRVIASLGELAPFIAATAVLIGVIYAQPDLLYYPIASLSALAVLVLMSMMNSMPALLIFRWDNRARTWREAVLPLLVGLVAALVELALLGYLRAQLIAALGLPF
ncbi:MAG: DUF2085 domain-containing protein [Chloroflexi bacterium]|nr:DUF2085 domain-containing protein [Chloroflexota bacterium]